MYWWIKDVFVDRYSNTEIEYRQSTQQPKVNLMSELLANVVNGLIVFKQSYQQRKMLKQAAKELSTRTDHQLEDMGLTREALYLMSKGKRPLRYTDSAYERTKPQVFELVSNQAVNKKLINKQNVDEQRFNRAA